jgi:hypothetical protein
VKENATTLKFKTAEFELLGTDKELCVIKNPRSKKDVGGRVGDVVSIRTTHGDVWDARWLSENVIIAAFADGTIALCRYDGKEIVGDVSVTKAKTCRNVRTIGSRNNVDYVVIGCEEPVFPIIRVDRAVPSLLEIGRLPYPDKDKMQYRRVATLPRGTSSSLIAVPSERGISVYQWDEGSEASLGSNVAIEDCRGCVFDFASTRFAVAKGDEIQIFRSFVKASSEDPQVVKSTAAVTAMSFGRFGQSLVWGTEDGGVYSAATIDPEAAS